MVWEMFRGHKFYRVDDGWVFDLTECVGYKINIDNQGTIKEYIRQFSINPEYMQTEQVQGVPQEIVDESLEIVRQYFERAGLVEKA